jgi:hypothetical protein
LTLWAESGTLTAMAAHASSLGAAPVASKKRATWTPQEVPKVAPKNYVGAYFSERYLLRRRIGAGGMSTVYEAQDSTLGKRVVVKILRDDLPSDPVDRFRREAHLLAGLTHEHIAQIIDRQDPDNEPRFLVTEYIDGQDLGELLGRGPMPAAVVLAIGVQVCAALAYAHDAGVIHRDVKPSNLMLARHPSGDIFVKVIDFGIAKLMQDSELAAPGRAPAGARRETLGNIVLGTAPFWCGEEGPQADVYALALTLAVLLTGKIPPVGVKVDLSNDTIPRNLASVLETALALDGEIATMDALDAALCEVRDSLDLRVAEGERRRYAAEMFGKSKVAAASKADAAASSSACAAVRRALHSLRGARPGRHGACAGRVRHGAASPRRAQDDPPPAPRSGELEGEVPSRGACAGSDRPPRCAEAARDRKPAGAVHHHGSRRGRVAQDGKADRAAPRALAGDRPRRDPGRRPRGRRRAPRRQAR